jgi:hypothetical protein
MKLKLELTKRISALALAVALLAGPAGAIAGDIKPDENKKKAEKVKPLKDKENPLMIGKRNINKGNLDFYRKGDKSRSPASRRNRSAGQVR